MTSEWPVHFRPDVVRHAFGGGRLTSYCLALEAWRRGLEVTFLDRALRNYRISDGETTLTFNDSRPQTLTRKADYSRLMSKSETNSRLRAHGVPAPAGRLLDTAETTEEELRAVAEEVGYPMVLKPNAGSMGQGVLTGLRSWEELRDGYRHLVDGQRGGSGHGDLLLESQHEGDDHRVLVVGEQVVAATRRVPTNVVGDGSSTVAELIKAKNRERRKNPFLSSGLIKVDYEVEGLLAERGLSTDSVPEAGAHVQLRRMANGSAGADVIDVTEELPEAVKQAAVEAVQAFENIHIAGVDLLYQPGQDGADGSYVIIELNSRPHIPTNMYPTSGIGRDVPRAMLDHFFPSSRRSEHPGDDSLVYDYPAIAEVLGTRAAGQIALRPLPRHHYPVRRRCRITAGSEFGRMPALRRQRIERQAATLDIIGDVTQPEPGAVEAVLAAPDERSADRFVEMLREAVRGEPAEVEPWDGVVTAGLRIARRIVGAEG